MEKREGEEGREGEKGEGEGKEEGKQQVRKEEKNVKVGNSSRSR